MLDIIAAAVMLSFGILAIYFSLEKGASDQDLLIALLLGVAAVVGGGWIILTKLTLAIILTKLAGLIILGLGVFLIFAFPDVSPDYQPWGMGVTGVLIGIILLIIGGWLLFF
jgi:hypothetical protein